MSIKITRSGDGYTAVATPPDSDVGVWQTSMPLSANELINELQKIGCHTTDISDALYETDPFWLNRTGSDETGSRHTAERKKSDY